MECVERSIPNLDVWESPVSILIFLRYPFLFCNTQPSFLLLWCIFFLKVFKVKYWVCWRSEEVFHTRLKFARTTCLIPLIFSFFNFFPHSQEPHRVYPSIPASLRHPIRVLSLFDGIATGKLQIVMAKWGSKAHIEYNRAGKMKRHFEACIV